MLSTANYILIWKYIVYSSYFTAKLYLLSFSIIIAVTSSYLIYSYSVEYTIDLSRSAYNSIRDVEDGICNFK